MADPIKIIIRILAGLFIYIAATSGYGKPITLYDEPKDSSKIVGTLDSKAGVITIYTPKDKAWAKVADPRNGNVGWIKSSDIANTGFSFNVITSGDGAHGYQLYQYGGSNAHSSEMMQKEWKAMEQRHRAIQENMRHMMNDMFGMFYYPTSFFVPVVVMPEQNAAPKNPVPPQNTAKTVTSPQVVAKTSATKQ